MNANWRSLDTQKPPMGVKLVVSAINQNPYSRVILHPVYYMEHPYRHGRGFYFGSFDKPLLPEITRVTAWDYPPEPYD